MTNEHLVLCGSARLGTRKGQWRDAKVHPLRIGWRKGQIRVRIEHITQKMAAALPKEAADLVEIGAYVYSADQTVTRGGLKSFDYGNAWRRQFRFDIPVRCPDLWNRPEVNTKLAEVLGFLSDDDYEFNFTKLKNPPPFAQYLFDQTEEECDIEEVLLFSGGLDSFGGAVQEIIQGQRKVALVSHRPVSKLYWRQRGLVRDLTDRITDKRYSPLHVPVEINISNNKRREYTQRSRSFLFAVLGAVVARSLSLDRIRFYENGVISLNLPISPQVAGGRATRTTHPQVLNGLQELFSMIFGDPFTVENPYLWKTKTDILQDISAAGCSRLCARTSSCTHTQAMTRLHSHCGRCSQCLDRRLNAIAAGYDDTEDPEQMYASSVLTGQREGIDYALIERYIGMAREIDRMNSAVAFAKRFGEMSRVLRHVRLPAQDAAEAIFKLYKRHANQICHALSAVVSEHSSLVVSTDYPAKSLLAIAVDRRNGAHDPDPGNTTPIPPASDNGSERTMPVVDRDTFTVHHRGRKCELSNTMEFALIERLSRQPGQYFSVSTLMEEVWDDRKVEKNTVQRTASNLRRKLREAGLDSIEIDGTTNRDHYSLKCTCQ
jgi:hypothetical protein